MYINRIDNSSHQGYTNKVKTKKTANSEDGFDSLLEAAIVDSVELTDPDGKRKDSNPRSFKKENKEDTKEDSTSVTSSSQVAPKSLNVTA